MLRIAWRRLPGRIVQKASKIRYTCGWIGSRKWLLCGRSRLWPLLKGCQKRLKCRPIHGRNKISKIGSVRESGQWGRRDLRRRGRHRRNSKGRVWRDGARGTAALHGLSMEDNFSRNTWFHFGIFYFNASARQRMQ